MFLRIGIEIRVNQSLSILNKAPIFYDKNLTYCFNENIPINTIVGRIRAHCNNKPVYYLNQSLEYNLINGLNFINNKFAINSTSGDIRTITVLDYDENPFQTSFDLHISAICKNTNINNYNTNNLTPDYATVHLELIDL